MILVNCKYPQNSKSYKFCVGCSNRHSCVDFTEKSHIPKPEVKPPKNIIPLATEANKMTFENIENCWTQQLQEISKRIENAISTGKFSKLLFIIKTTNFVNIIKKIFLIREIGEIIF